ncbi:MAG: endonuclease/exonuclease/phosphatase family protein [Nitrosomonas sp.]|nr:MAG: endonuclease/exonuclease/phosphatase family protein [Nitrosomonas sp.]
MRNIRILTINIQAQAWPAGPHSDAEWRAHAVVKALDPGNFAFDEHPDVVVFNEADNEDAKEILETGLKNIYPHYIVSFNGGSGDLNDGGLAIFSKFEFRELPPSDNNFSNNRSRFYPYISGLFYPMSASDDGLAEKGVAIVQISTGLHFEVVTIALTHLQAFYEEVGEHHTIRLRQLKVIEGALIELIGAPEDNANWDKVIVLGDLNIRGDTPPYSTDGHGEWTNVFINNGGPYNNASQGIPFRQNQLIFTGQLIDGWRTFMTPPGAFMEADPGLTNTNLKEGEHLPAGLKERLDYICFPKQRTDAIGETPRRLVAQHMRILPSNFSALDMTFERIQSDHKGILALVHWQFPYNTPNQAKLQGDFLHFQAPDSLVKVHIANDLKIPSPGVFQWIYIQEPGTYTLNHSANLDAAFYFENDMSTRIDPFNQVKWGELGLDNDWLNNLQHEFQLSETGDQVDVHRPMFIRLKAAERDDQFTGNIAFSFIKHTGENRFLAIGLLPNDIPKDPRLPIGQKNGKNDECWFRAPLAEQLLSGNSYRVQFYIKNDFKRKIRLSLFEGISAPAPFEQASNEDRLTLIDYDRAAAIKDVYILLERGRITDYEFLAGYRYSISYLNHLEIYSIDDQSGLGADEIHLTMTADDMATNFLDFTDEDFDDDERRMLNSYYPQNVAFENRLNVTVFELDSGADDDGPFTGTIPALAKGESKRESSIIIEADGAQYQLIYKLSRYPNR